MSNWSSDTRLIRIHSNKLCLLNDRRTGCKNNGTKKRCIVASVYLKLIAIDAGAGGRVDLILVERKRSLFSRAATQPAESARELSNENERVSVIGFYKWVPCVWKIYNNSMKRRIFPNEYLMTSRATIFRAGQRTSRESSEYKSLYKRDCFLSADLSLSPKKV